MRSGPPASASVDLLDPDVEFFGAPATKATPTVVAAPRVHVVSRSPPDDEAHKSAKAANLAELDAALAESLAFERSQEDEATMRRVRLQEAAERRDAALEALNASTLRRLAEELGVPLDEHKRAAAVRESPHDDDDDQDADAAEVDDVGGAPQADDDSTSSSPPDEAAQTPPPPPPQSRDDDDADATAKKKKKKKTPPKNLAAFLVKLAADYAAEARGIEARGPRGGLSSAALDAPMCRECGEFHGLAQWGGRCSRCHEAAERTAAALAARGQPPGPDSASSSSCLPVLPLLRGVVHGGGGGLPTTTRGASSSRGGFVGRVFRREHRRRSLPAPPTPEAAATGRRLLEARLAAHRRRGRDVKGDGACQFRAVSHQLWEDEQYHGLVRERAVRQLRDDPPDVFDCEVYVSRSGPFGGFAGVRVEPVGDAVGTYLDTMRLDESWGDATTLQAVATVFRVRILLVTTHSTNHELIIEPEHEPAIREIWLGFYSEMHYISVVPAGAPPGA